MVTILFRVKVVFSPSAVLDGINRLKLAGGKSGTV